LFTWHHPQWLRLWEQASLPHALLLIGPDGIGKSEFAQAMAARLLCQSPHALGACGQCDSCRWLGTGNHPDFVQVSPEGDGDPDSPSDGEKKKGKRQILIDQIRALSDFVYIGAHRGGCRVVLIDPASAMNTAAANALLKILEEPPASVYFILVTSNEHHVLPTVRSRCRVLRLPKPPAAEALQWIEKHATKKAADFLDFAGGAPLLAAKTASGRRGQDVDTLLSTFAEPESTPTELAGRWEKLIQVDDDGLRIEDVVVALQKWLVGLALLKTENRERFLGRFAATAAGLSRRANLAGLLHCYNDLLKIRALASHPLNSRLMLEDLAERYLRALATDRR
jgi:DNA polymerase-3 subunit delta'